jgi:Na+/H+-dicarboxylate symporter
MKPENIVDCSVLVVIVIAWVVAIIKLPIARWRQGRRAKSIWYWFLIGYMGLGLIAVFAAATLGIALRLDREAHNNPATVSVSAPPSSTLSQPTSVNTLSPHATPSQSIAQDTGSETDGDILAWTIVIAITGFVIAIGTIFLALRHD